MPNIYLATVLLEKNRWKSRVPSISLADWLPRILEAGFDGIELWENHVLGRPDELAVARDAGLPTAVFNTYLTFSNDTQERLDAVCDAIAELKAPAVKFNIDGRASLEVHRENLLSFAGRLPKSCRMLCECHGGTPLEETNAAAAFLDSLPGDRFGAILHGFGDPDEVLARYQALRRHVAHMHVQTRTADKDSGRFAANIRNLTNAGFQGSWSIEFTECSRDPKNDSAETAFEYACGDMKALREVLGV